jgi:hypothetical protein
MNAFVSFDLFMVYKTAKNYEIIYVDTILHTLNLGCRFITLREPYNNQWPKCDIAGLILQIIYTAVFRVKRLNNLTLHVRMFYCLTWQAMV